MPQLTWNEFKEYVDIKLREQGTNGDVVIDYIDVVRPSNEEGLCEVQVTCDYEGISIFQ